MRECSWHVVDKGLVNKAYEKLEHVSAMDHKNVSYVGIFSQEAEVDKASQLRRGLLNFLDMQADFDDLKQNPLDLHSDKKFIKSFRRLVRAIEGDESKRLKDQAKTDIYPQKNFYPNG